MEVIGMKKVKIFKFDLAGFSMNKKIAIAEEEIQDFIQNKTIVSFAQSSNSVSGNVVYTIVYEEE